MEKALKFNTFVFFLSAIIVGMNLSTLSVFGIILVISGLIIFITEGWEMLLGAFVVSGVLAGIAFFLVNTILN